MGELQRRRPLWPPAAGAAGAALERGARVERSGVGTSASTSSSAGRRRAGLRPRRSPALPASRAESSTIDAW
ncbi:MAG: hypothetical protein KF878_09550 [Planctomycetes bacterium]|nr:hypothetical protein [Planctomycetota bacterium]